MGTAGSFNIGTPNGVQVVALIAKGLENGRNKQVLPRKTAQNRTREDKVVANLFNANSKGAFLRSVVTIIFCSTAIAAQTSNDKCRPAVIPVENEPPPKIFIDPPLAEPLARGVAIIQYCAENLHIVPVFGPKALPVTPRVGHLHVRVDDASWVWAEASGNPIILMGLAPGPHKVSIELVNANHQTLDRAETSFVIPKKLATGISPEKAESPVASSEKAMKVVPGSPRQTTMSHHHPR